MNLAVSIDDISISIFIIYVYTTPNSLFNKKFMLQFLVTRHVKSLDIWKHIKKKLIKIMVSFMMVKKNW